MNRLKKTFWLIFSCFMLLISCQDNSVNVESEKEAVKQTLTSMWEAIENEDINKYASFIHPDFTQFGEYDSILRIGKNAEVAGIKSWIETSENFPLFIKPAFMITKAISYPLKLSINSL